MGLSVQIPFVAKTIPLRHEEIIDPDIEKYYQEKADYNSLDGKFLIEVLKNLKNRKPNESDTTLWMSTEAYTFFLSETDYFLEYQGDLYVWESVDAPEILSIVIQMITSPKYATYLSTKDGKIVVGLDFLDFLTPTDELITVIENFYKGEEIKKPKNLKLIKS